MDSWATPDWLMKVFGGWYDPCPLNADFDGLEESWDKKYIFINPPYSDPLPWVEKAIRQSKKGKVIAMLLKVDTSTKWFAKLNEANAHFLWFSKRLKFSNKGSANFPSMLVILDNATPKPKSHTQLNKNLSDKTENKTG